MKLPSRILHPILTAIFMFAVLATSAQEPVRMSLEQAIQFANEQSLTIKNAKIAVEDAQQQIIERRASGLPQLNGDASLQHYLQVPKQPLPPSFLRLCE